MTFSYRIGLVVALLTTLILIGQRVRSPADRIFSPWSDSPPTTG